MNLYNFKNAFTTNDFRVNNIAFYISADQTDMHPCLHRAYLYKHLNILNS